MGEMEERELVERAKHDPEAFGQLYQRYIQRIYNYHYRHIGNHAEAEDLASRTFYRALRSIQSYHDRGHSFQAWLFRIAHNLMANTHRDHARRPSVPLDDLLLATETDNPPQDLEAAELRWQLRRAFAALSEERKTLIILKFVERMSNAEVAVVLGKTEGAIKALYSRTLQSLRQLMVEGGAYEA